MHKTIPDWKLMALVLIMRMAVVSPGNAALGIGKSNDTIIPTSDLVASVAATMPATENGPKQAHRVGKKHSVVNPA
jgi:hypothetical protein